MKKIFNKEKAINDLKDIYKKEGKVNADLLKKYSVYSFNTYKRHFGSFNNALEQADLMPTYNQLKTENIDEQELINELKRLQNTYGKITAKIIEEHGNFGIRRYKKKFGSLEKAYDKIGYIPKQRKNISKEELEIEMQRIISKYGYFSKPLVEKYGKFTPKVYQRVYGNFKNIYKEYGLQRNPSGYIPTDQELFDEAKRLIDEYGDFTVDIIDNYSKFSATCFRDRANKMGADHNMIDFYKNYFNFKSPTDNKSKGFIVAEKILSEYFNENPIREKTFEWLKNPETNAYLFLDAYFPKANVAMEYNGIQHYKISTIFTTTKEELQYRQHLDRLKIRLCKEHGIKIIVIKYDDKIDYDFIKNKITD